MYIVAVLVVLIIVTISGCTDKPEDIQKGVNTHIYVDMGQEGDPEKQIHDFYDIALQEAGDPVIKPLAQYAAEYELDLETGHVIPDTIKIYDPDGNSVDRETALAMQDNIATDDAGNIITDAALLDIHIEEIGKNKYKIHNLKQELQVEDGVWRVSHEMGNKYSGDTKFNDNIFKINDGLDEMCSGIVLDDNGTPHGIILIDEDTWELYGGDFGLHRYENAEPINKEDCVHLGNGICAYVFDLSEVPKDRAAAVSLHPISADIDKAKENGGYAQFMFVKESI